MNENLQMYYKDYHLHYEYAHDIVQEPTIFWDIVYSTQTKTKEFKHTSTKQSNPSFKQALPTSLTVGFSPIHKGFDLKNDYRRFLLSLYDHL